MQPHLPLESDGSKTVSFRIPVGDYERLEREGKPLHLTIGALCKQRALAGGAQGELGAIELRGRLTDLEKQLSRIHDLEALVAELLTRNGEMQTVLSAFLAQSSEAVKSVGPLVEESADISKNLVLLRADLLFSAQVLLMVAGGWSQEQAQAWVQKRIGRPAC